MARSVKGANQSEAIVELNAVKVAVTNGENQRSAGHFTGISKSWRRRAQRLAVYYETLQLDQRVDPALQRGVQFPDPLATTLGE